MTSRNHGLLLGAHMSVAGGVDKAPARGAAVDSTALQVFVKSSRRWADKPLDPASVAAWPAALEQSGIAPSAVVAHTSYLINLASPNPEVLAKSLAAVEDELRRCDALGIPGIVMHPGAHLGSGREAAIEQIARSVRAVYARPPEIRTRLLFEATAGTGTNLGATFEDLRDILAAVDLPDRTGVCLDTCHIFAAGYDIRTKKTYDETMRAFERLVGFDSLFAIHLNDSKHGLGSRKDRHEHIGQGLLGSDAFALLLNDPRVKNVPMVLETDKNDDLDEDRMNLETLRGLVKNQRVKGSASRC